MKLIAFLRAINVGGHTVTMEALRGHFAAMGFKDAKTFIASGNVIFESKSADTGAVERKIEAHLEKVLGYEVRTFIRTAEEVAAIARYRPFTLAQMKSAGALNIALLAAPLPASARKALMAHRGEVDDFHVNGREAYWRCAGRGSESPFFKLGFERVLKVPVTVRGANTVAKLAARYGGGSTST